MMQRARYARWRSSTRRCSVSKDLLRSVARSLKPAHAESSPRTTRDDAMRLRTHCRPRSFDEASRSGTLWRTTLDETDGGRTPPERGGSAKRRRQRPAESHRAMKGAVSSRRPLVESAQDAYRTGKPRSVAAKPSAHAVWAYHDRETDNRTYRHRRRSSHRPESQASHSILERCFGSTRIAGGRSRKGITTGERIIRAILSIRWLPTQSAFFLFCVVLRGRPRSPSTVSVPSAWPSPPAFMRSSSTTRPLNCSIQPFDRSAGSIPTSGC